MTDKAKQKQAVLDRLKAGPATTWELGYGLRICCMTRRVFELREEGYVITKTREQRNGKGVWIYRLLGQCELPLEIGPARQSARAGEAC